METNLKRILLKRWDLAGLKKFNKSTETKKFTIRDHWSGDMESCHDLLGDPGVQEFKVLPSYSLLPQKESKKLLKTETRKNKVEITTAVESSASAFDYDFDGTTTTNIFVPMGANSTDSFWSGSGAIFGPSGIKIGKYIFLKNLEKPRPETLLIPVFLSTENCIFKDLSQNFKETLNNLKGK